LSARKDYFGDRSASTAEHNPQLDKMTSIAAFDPISNDLESIDVSIIMAAYNSEQYIREAIDSCLKQTEVTFELIIIDDGSDRTLAPLVEEFTNNDPRVILLASERNHGPGHARNLGFNIARGEFLAIVDSDDFILPNRLSSLIAQGRETGADIIVDNLVEFFETQRGRLLSPFFKTSAPKHERVISLTEYMNSAVRSEGTRCYGYLKPVIRRSALKSGQYAYRASLQISEDYYLVADLLRGGATMLFIPEAGYHYRKHAGSLTHRADLNSIKAIVDTEKAFRTDVLPALTPQQAQLSKRRSQIFHRLHQFEKMVYSIKQREYLEALRTLMKRPPDIPFQVTKVLWLLLKRTVLPQTGLQ